MLYFIIWNSIVFLVYALDKFFAIKGMWRISEKMLLTLAFLMGGVGAVIGMIVCHHKTRKNKFSLLIPLAVVFNFIIILKKIKLQ